MIISAEFFSSSLHTRLTLQISWHFSWFTAVLMRLEWIYCLCKKANKPLLNEPIAVDNITVQEKP